LEETAKDLDSAPELGEIELFVGRVKPVIGKADAGEDYRRPGEPQLGHDGNRSAGAHLHRLPTRHRFEGLVQYAERRRIDVYLNRVATVEQGDLYLCPLGSHLGDRSFERLPNLLELQPWHQAKADL